MIEEGKENTGLPEVPSPFVIDISAEVPVKVLFVKVSAAVSTRYPAVLLRAARAVRVASPAWAELSAVAVAVSATPSN